MNRTPVLRLAAGLLLLAAACAPTHREAGPLDARLTRPLALTAEDIAPRAGMDRGGVMSLDASPRGREVAGDEDGDGELSETELAKQTQNPVADLISFPLQLNSGYGAGLRDNTQHVLNVQPVIPQSVSEDWLLIHRPIAPIIGQPAFSARGSTTGLGNVLYQSFFSPKDSGALIWGVGPAVQLPTSRDDRLGEDAWAAGPSVVALTMQGPWVAGAVASNVWAVSSGEDGDFLTLQPFVNYNFGQGWYAVSAPILTADWDADGASDVWTVPVGGGFGRTFRIGKRPFNVNVQAFSHVVHPTNGPEWSTRLQIAALFPRKG